MAIPLAGGATAQVAVSASLATDYRYRGVSLSDGNPTLGVNLSYDQGAGAYVGGSVVGGESAQAGVRILGFTEYLGYAHRIGTDVTGDVGVSDTRFVQYYNSTRFESNTEIYSGFRTRHFSYYLYYSPRYFEGGPSTVYAEINAAYPFAPKWRVFGHLGVLTPLDRAQPYSLYRREQYDLRAGVAAAFKGGEAQLAWTSARGGSDPTASNAPDRDALVFAVTLFF
ncbi:MAG: TorF family putative porin [Caulobacteraceae bacterium]